MNTLWVDKYSPKSVEDYIFENDEIKNSVKEWIRRGWTDNLLLVGPPGTGKTSLGYVLMNELGVDSEDFLQINASRENGINVIREIVSEFLQHGGWGTSHKYILLDEADGLTHAAQPALRTDMVEYSETVRWILTANSKHKILPALQDRCTVIELTRPDKDKVFERLLYILDQENIEIEYNDDFINLLSTIVNTYYPSVRKCIRELQNCTINNKLIIKKEFNEDDKDEEWKFKIVDLFKANNISDGRKLISANLFKEDVDNYLIWLAANLDLFNDEGHAIMTISRALVDNRITASPEINLSATLIKLTQGIEL